MQKFQIVQDKVEKLYQNSNEEFGKWMWKYHVPYVAQKAEELCKRFEGNADYAVAGALLHDIGDALVYRFDPSHEQLTQRTIEQILLEAGYSDDEIQLISQEVIAPHSCRNGYAPSLLEGKILATADALAHLETDFYLQFCWKHLPEGKDFNQFKHWVYVKADRDFNAKILFPEVRNEVNHRYKAIKTLFA